MADSEEEEPTSYRQEKFFFKRMGWGWVFRSPISWWPLALGPRRYYLLNEAQKAQTARAMFDMEWRRRALLVAASLAGNIPPAVLAWKAVPWAVGHEWRLGLLFLAPPLLGVLWYQFIYNLVVGQALRPILAGAASTSNRISFAEQARASAATQSVATWIFGGLVAAATSGFGAYDWLVSAPRIVGLSAAILGGLAAAFCFAMVRIKLKAKLLSPF
jgi:hypothetical protein